MSDRQHMIETIRMWWGDPRGASDIADAIIDSGRWVPRADLDAAQDEIEKLMDEVAEFRYQQDQGWDGKE